MEKGLFVVIEGMDNSGKTTQVNLLKQYLEERRIPVFPTREPGGTEIGEEIRGILLKNRDQGEMMSPEAQALFFYAARSVFLDKVVQPALDEGKIVITDRFEPSSYVYQGYAQGAIEQVETLSKLVVGQKYWPDRCVVLDIPAEESLRRRENVDNAGQDLIFEHQGLEFAWKLRAGYQEYARKHPSVVLLDGTQSVDKIHQQILICLKPLLLLKGFIDG